MAGCTERLTFWDKLFGSLASEAVLGLFAALGLCEACAILPEMRKISRI